MHLSLSAIASLQSRPAIKTVKEICVWLFAASWQCNSAALDSRQMHTWPSSSIWWEGHVRCRRLRFLTRRRIQGLLRTRLFVSVDARVSDGPYIAHSLTFILPLTSRWDVYYLLYAFEACQHMVAYFCFEDGDISARIIGPRVFSISISTAHLSL